MQFLPFDSVYNRRGVRSRASARIRHGQRTLSENAGFPNRNGRNSNLFPRVFPGGIPRSGTVVMTRARMNLIIVSAGIFAQ